MDTPAQPSFAQFAWFWFRVGCTSFGGPTGQVALMHQEVVEGKKWVREDEFLRALNFCMLLPGPEAQQLATWIGWRLFGTRGALVSGSLFVLPAALLLWGLSWLYVTLHTLPAVGGILHGLQAAVLGIIIAASLRIGKRVLKTRLLALITLIAFLALFVAQLNFVAVLLFAALGGLLAHPLAPGSLGAAAAPKRSPDAVMLAPLRNELLRSGRTALLGTLLWLGPVVLTGLFLGWQGVHLKIGSFFSQSALLTFGGAYSILPYVAQQAVQHYAWLSQEQMMAGLALAETTPGPLIIVLQFVGFVAAWQAPGSLPPLSSATLGAFLSTWCTFVPSFIWILCGAPFLARLEQHRHAGYLQAALAAITAAVLGVIISLALWFAWQTLWLHSHGLDYFALLLSVASLLALLRLKVGSVWVVFAAAILGLCFG